MLSIQTPNLIVIFVLLLFYSLLGFLVTYVVLDHFCGRYPFIFFWILNWVICGILGILLMYNVVFCRVDAYLEWLALRIPYLLPIEFGVIADELSVKMACLVLLISFCVQLFSLEYMRYERRQIQFMIILHAFTFFMLLFVFSANLVQAFIAWEGLGFVSFMLINFWSAREEANKAAVKAIIFNRIADIWFILAIIICLLFINTGDFCDLNALSYSKLQAHIYIFVPFVGNCRLFDFVAFSIFMASIGKSAQLGYHVWLTAAMEGPSPVSALLHSATMVTAGVYLLLRFYDLFNTCHPIILILLILLGSVTCFACGWFAFTSIDFKRIIAYSTCSHLGLMFCFIGFNFIEVVELHLHIHAFFKTTLFLCAGLVMSVLCHLQNFRKIASFALFLPICYSLFSFASLSLLGVPYTIGSMSKERFLMLGYLNTDIGFISSLHFAAAVSALLTAVLYTIKLLLNIAFRPGFNGEHQFYLFMGSERTLIWISQFMLCVLIVCFVYLGSMYFMRGMVEYDSWRWLNTFLVFYTIHLNTLPFLLKFFLILFLILFYIFLTIRFRFYSHKPVISNIVNEIESVSTKSKFIPLPLNLNWSIRGLNRFVNAIGSLFNYFESYLSTLFYKIFRFYNHQSYKLFETFERGFIEITGPVGIVSIIKKLITNILSYISIKHIRYYIREIICFILLVLLCIILCWFNINPYKIIFIYVCIIFYIFFVL